MRVIGVDPDMTELAFIGVLKAAGSPALSSAHAVYQECVKRRVSPAFLLAMFQHESGYGLHGWAAKTFSWGNTRPPSFGAIPTVVFDQDSGDWYYWEGARPSGRRYLCAYRDWIDGGVSTVARFVEHAPYAGKTTVEEIIPVWAPSSDGNDTARYIAAVLASMAQWTKEEPVSTQPIPVKLTPALTALDIRHLLPKKAGGGDSRKSSPKRGVILHYNGPAVDMDRPGLAAYIADAQYHIGPYLNEYSIAYHWGIDGAGQLYQLRDWDATLWHCGAWPENMTWWAVNVWLGKGQHARPAQIATAVALLDYLSQSDGFSRQNVKGHQEVSATECPGTLMADLVLPYRAGEFTPPTPQDAAAKERSLLLSYGEAVNATLTGTLEREGAYDATEFGGTTAERLAVYSRFVVNRLRGESYVMPLDLWDRLRGQGKVVLY